MLLYNLTLVLNCSLLMTVEELAELIARSPKLSESFVSRYVDTNGELCPRNYVLENP